MFFAREIILSLALIASICPVLWAPGWPPTFLFFPVHLRHLSHFLGQSVYFSPSAPWMSSFIHWLYPCSSQLAFFCCDNWSSALQEQVDDWFVALKNFKKIFLFCLLLHQSFSQVIVQPILSVCWLISLNICHHGAGESMLGSFIEKERWKPTHQVAMIHNI